MAALYFSRGWLPLFLTLSKRAATRARSFSRRRHRKVAVSERQKPEGLDGRLCPTLYPSRPPAGRMISHLFRRLISSQQPFRYSPSLSLSLSIPLSLSRLRLLSEAAGNHLRSDPTSETTGVTIKDHSLHRVCLLTEALIKSRRESRKRRMGSTRASRIIFATLRPFRLLVLPSSFEQSLFLASPVYQRQGETQ